MRPCYQRVNRAYAGARRRAVVLVSLARMELLSGSGASPPLSRRLWLWRHGFTSRTEALFDLTPENRHEFPSEYREGLTRGINGGWRRAMSDKLTSRLLLKPFERRLPEFYGIVADGVARRTSPPRTTRPDIRPAPRSRSATSFPSSTRSTTTSAVRCASRCSGRAWRVRGVVRLVPARTA